MVLPVRPFCSAGLRPVTPPRSLLHLPSRRFEKALERGAFLIPDRVTPRIHQSGASCPTPLLLTQRVGIQAEAPGGRFRREKFGWEMAKMVVGNVVKVALWCGWRGC